MTEIEQQQLLQVMASIERLLEPTAAAPRQAPYLLRPHRPGGIGWVIGRYRLVKSEPHRSFGHDLVGET